MTPPPFPPDFLTLDGVPVPVKYGGGTEAQLDRSGELVTTWYNNTFTSENDAEAKRSWRFTTWPLDGDTEWLYWRPILEGAAFLTAAGVAISRAMVPVDPLDPTGPQQPDSVQVMPAIADVVHRRDTDADIAYEVTFTLTEV